VILQVVDNKLEAKSQISDYENQGTKLELFSFFQFLLDSYEPSTSVNILGNPSNSRIPYLNASDVYKNRFRVLRTPGHEMMPDFLGQWLPRWDDPNVRNFYVASVLMLLKPWREVGDILEENSTWEDTFTSFLSSTSESTVNLLDNFQFYYACESLAAKKKGTDETCRNNEEANTNLLEDEICAMNETEQTVEDIDDIANNAVPTREVLNGRQAVDIGERVGVFSNCDQWTIKDASVTTAERVLLEKNMDWQNIIKQYSRTTKNSMPTQNAQSSIDSIPVIGGSGQTNDAAVDTITEKESVNAYPDGICNLSNDQRRAVGIIDRHL
jgi:hypothetical protein